MVIYVCSPNFKESPDCQYELAWGFKKEIDKKFFLAINKKELRSKVKLYSITTFQTFHISDFVKLREKLDSIFGHAADAAIWADKAAKLIDKVNKKHNKKTPTNRKKADQTASSSKATRNKEATVKTSHFSHTENKKDIFKKSTSNQSTKIHNTEDIEPSSKINACKIYNQLLENAGRALSKLEVATKWMIFATHFQGRDKLRNGEYGCNQKDFQKARDCKQLDHNYDLNIYERHVQHAIETLDELHDFINDDANYNFIEGLSNELDMEIALDNSKFWKEVF